MIKRVLLVGVLPSKKGHYTYTLSFIHALVELGYSVEAFNYRAYPAFIANMVLCYKVQKYKPDIIFVLKGELLKASILRWIKNNSNAYLINFYPDNPFTFWNGNSNKEVLLALPIYDSFLIWSQQLIPLLQASGGKNIQYFPFGFDKTIFSNQKLSKNHHAAFDVCFVGSWELAREQWLAAVLRAKVSSNIVIWGDRWSCAQDSFVLRAVQGSALYYKKLVQVLQSSKIVLNFIRTQNMNAHNMRTIEVPASGAFLLSERTEEQAHILFKEKESISCFSSQEECIDNLDWYLHHDQERQEVAWQGNKKVQEYELTKLLRQVFSAL